MTNIVFYCIMFFAYQAYSINKIENNTDKKNDDRYASSNRNIIDSSDDEENYESESQNKENWDRNYSLNDGDRKQKEVSRNLEEHTPKKRGGHIPNLARLVRNLSKEFAKEDVLCPAKNKSALTKTTDINKEDETANNAVIIKSQEYLEHKKQRIKQGVIFIQIVPVIDINSTNESSNMTKENKKTLENLLICDDERLD